MDTFLVFKVQVCSNNSQTLYICFVLFYLYRKLLLFFQSHKATMSLYSYFLCALLYSVKYRYSFGSVYSHSFLSIFRHLLKSYLQRQRRYRRTCPLSLSRNTPPRQEQPASYSRSPLIGRCIILICIFHNHLDVHVFKVIQGFFHFVYFQIMLKLSIQMIVVYIIILFISTMLSLGVQRKVCQFLEDMYMNSIYMQTCVQKGCICVSMKIESWTHVRKKNTLFCKEMWEAFVAYVQT